MSENRKTKRDEIIEVAAQLFYQQGYGATGIKQIIDEVGTAKGTFYSHFSSKDELGLEWLKRQEAFSDEWFSKVLGRYKEPGEKLLATFEFLKEWQAQAKYRGCAFINTASETPDRSAPLRILIARNKQSVRNTFQDLAVDHFVQQGFSAGDSRAKGTTIYLLWEGALTETEIEGAPWPIEAAKAGAAEILGVEI